MQEIPIKEMPKGVRETIIRRLLQEENYVFISLAKRDGLVLNSNLDPQQWVQIFRRLYKHIGIDMSRDTATRIQSVLESRVDARMAELERGG